MTTKTDTSSILELKDNYKPAKRGIVSADENDLIYKTLELHIRNDIELQNIRDVAVMVYSQIATAGNTTAITKTYMEAMDAMSGICSVIDLEKRKRGLSV